MMALLRILGRILVFPLQIVASISTGFIGGFVAPGVVAACLAVYWISLVTIGYFGNGDVWYHFVDEYNDLSPFGKFIANPFKRITLLGNQIQEKIWEPKFIPKKHDNKSTVPTVF